MAGETEIISNGSKWYGQNPDTIKKLIEVLAGHKLEEDCFSKTYYEHHDAWLIRCPISKENSAYVFRGNFEDLSHVFYIVTTDKATISKLRKAITANEGWSEYIPRLKNKIVIKEPCRYLYK